MQGPEDDDNQTASMVEDTDFSPWEDDDDENADEEWTWEPPNLRENQHWYRDRVESLKKQFRVYPTRKHFGKKACEHWIDTAQTRAMMGRNVCNCSGGNFPPCSGKIFEKEVA
jgi:hypothetical protein